MRSQTMYMGRSARVVSGGTGSHTDPQIAYFCPDAPVLRTGGQGTLTGSIASTLIGDSDDKFVRLKVGMLRIILCSHPHALRLASLRLGSAKVGQDNHSIEAFAIAVCSGRAETGATGENALKGAALSTLPNINIILGHLGVEGHNRELCEARQLVQFCVELRQHSVIHRAALVDIDADASLTGHFLACVDARETPVEAPNRRALVGAAAGLDEVP